VNEFVISVCFLHTRSIFVARQIKLLVLLYFKSDLDDSKTISNVKKVN